MNKSSLDVDVFGFLLMVMTRTVKIVMVMMQLTICTLKNDNLLTGNKLQDSCSSRFERVHHACSTEEMILRH